MQVKSTENEILSMLYQVTHSLSSKNLTLILAQTVYAIQLILICFITTDSQIQLLKNIVQSTTLWFVFASLTIAIILQIIIAYIYQVHFQLYIQLLFYRFIIFPLILVFLANEIRTPYFLSFWTSLILYIFTTFFVYLISYLVFNQSQEEQIVTNTSKFSILFVITDSLLIIIGPAGNSVGQQFFLIIWFFIQLWIHNNYKNVFKMNFKDKLLKFLIHQKQFLLFLIVIQLVLQTSTADSVTKHMLFQISLPIALIILLYSFFYTKTPQINKKIFSVQTTLGQFYSFIYTISSELALFKINKNMELQNSYLMMFIDIHNLNCTTSNCILLQKSTIQQLKNCNSPINRKIILHKIIKKIQYMFQLYQKQFSFDLSLKFFFLQFYSAHLPNKLKIKQLIAQINKYHVSFIDRLNLFRLKKRSQLLQTAQITGISKGQDDYEIFKKIMIQNLTHLRQFWSALIQEKVDINKLMGISAKLFPLKYQMQLIWKQHLSEVKFVSWNVIKMYAYYHRYIIHDPTKACILEDYCKILEQRLKDKHQLAYLSVQTQKGLIAISLSQSSLGDIVSLNNQSLKLFNYSSKSEMLSLRVNNIMPNVYSQIHDNILNSFLKNRYKQINQDQRFVFGKNKNNYIFPFLLQLNKLSWNANDQLIFISNCENYRTKKAPIFCITDLQGYIQDKTSTYAWLFCKKKELYKDSLQNIQEIIPNFFEVVEQEQVHGANSKYEFPEKYQIKKNSSTVIVVFEATVLYIKEQKVGYLVEGQTIVPMQTFQDGKPLKVALAQTQNYINNFCPTRLTYEIPNKMQPSKTTFMNELTIPYLQTSDIGKILNFQTIDKINYGKNIKTLRLVDNKLILANDQVSMSEFEQENQWKQMSVMKRIQNMREQFNVEENRDISSYYKVIAVLFTIVFILLSVLLITQIIAFCNDSLSNHVDYTTKQHIRSLLPQFLIYSYFPQSINGSQIIKNSIQNQLITALSYSSIDQSQKEQIMKSINSAQINGSVDLQNSILTFSTMSEVPDTYLIGLLYAITCLLLLFNLGLVGMFLFYKKTMSEVYSIFLSISSKNLKMILLQSTRLCDYLTSNLTTQIYSHIYKNNQTEVDEEQQQFQRLKKIQNEYSSQDLHLLSQFVLPILIVFVFSIFSSVFLTIQYKNYIQKVTIWKNGEQVLPQTSISIMNSLMSFLNISNPNLPTNFSQILHQFQQNLFISGYDFSDQFLLLKSDPCTYSTLYTDLNFNYSAFCSKSTTFDTSLSNKLNFITTFLQHSQNQTSSQWVELINIHFNFVKHLLLYSTSIINNLIDNTRTSLLTNTIIICVFFIILILIASFYLIRYPIKQISQKILFTKDLISIIPTQNRIMPINALSTLTTQVIQFKQYQ